MWCWIIIIILLFAGEVSAKEQGPAINPSIDSKLCEALTKHTPNADVNYQPGLDMHGKKVAPADLSPSTLEIPRKFDIPLTLNLAKALNLDATHYPTSQFGAGTEAQLGVLTVDGDKVLFNGKQISNAEEDNLAVLCMKADK